MLDKIASSTLCALESFFEEFEACKLKPNVVFMPETFYKALETVYPEKISSKELIRGQDRIRIILTKDEEGTVGVSFCLDTRYVDEYQ
jgi:hypothetical protein